MTVLVALAVCLLIVIGYSVLAKSDDDAWFLITFSIHFIAFFCKLLVAANYTKSSATA